MNNPPSSFCAILDYRQDGNHHWAVVHENCDTSDGGDLLLSFIAQSIRSAYGEDEIKAMADELLSVQSFPEPADSVASQFSLDTLLEAFRGSLPNPTAEGNKPKQLSNYRSETAEILAREALSAVFKLATPPSLYATKGNRNQPILGLDGWSVMSLESGKLALVLIQVKATDDKTRPPRDAAALIKECSAAPLELERLKGFLSACAIRCKGTPYASSIIMMMTKIQLEKKVSDLVVAPVIIRGKVKAHHDDLSTLAAATGSFSGAHSRGLCLSIGSDLNEFGEKAMNMARQA
jgi:hypothetical protein